VAISQVLNPLIRLFLTVALLVAGFSATGALWAYAAGEAFSAATLLYLVEKRIFPVFTVREKRNERIFEARAFIVYSLPLFLAGIIDLVMNNTDAWMSAYFLDNARVGLYGAAVTLASLVALGTELLNPMFLSIITRDYALGNQTGIVTSYNNNNRWMWYITLPMAAFLIALPGESMSLLWGKSFADGAWALAILAFGRTIYYLSTTSSFMLYMHGATRIILPANICSALLNVTLNYCLIPSLGITGAAIGTTVSLILQSLFLVWGTHFYHRGQGLRVFFSGIFTAALVPAAILILFKNFFPVSWSAIIGLAISYSAVYFLLLKVFRVFSAEDYRIWEGILSRLRGNKRENS
jgi:O-antigen/teichoic acid export membrane protein